MAGVVQVHPFVDYSTGTSFSGKGLIQLTVDLAVNATNFATTENGPLDSVREVINEIEKVATILAMSSIRSDGVNAGQVFDVILEGNFGSDDYNGDGSATTLAAQLQVNIRLLTAAGENDVNLSSATVINHADAPTFTVK